MTAYHTNALSFSIGLMLQRYLGTGDQAAMSLPFSTITRQAFTDNTAFTSTNIFKTMDSLIRRMRSMLTSTTACSDPTHEIVAQTTIPDQAPPVPAPAPDSSLGALAILPPELRLMIYTKVLSDHKTEPIREHLRWPHRQWAKPSQDYEYYFRRPAILKVSRMVRDEVIPLFYEKLSKIYSEKDKAFYGIHSSFEDDSWRIVENQDLHESWRTALKAKLAYRGALKNENFRMSHEGYRDLVFSEHMPAGRELAVEYASCDFDEIPGPRCLRARSTPSVCACGRQAQSTIRPETGVLTQQHGSDSLATRFWRFFGNLH